MITLTNAADFEKYTSEGCVAALGAFDALHIGHMRIISRAAEYAHSCGKKVLVQLFELPPSMSAENAECVNTLEDRLRVLDRAGVDFAVTESFTEDFMKLGCEAFVRRFLKEKYHAEAVFVGYNYTFGYRAEGDAKRLCEECGKLGIRVFVQECVELDGEVSSTQIRELIKRGDVERAEVLMGRPYAVSGTVIRGRQLGRTIGFPTVNIEIPRGMAIPRSGVYKTKVLFEDKSFAGITNVGGKPTVAADEENIETNIIGYDGDLYGEKIRLEFVRRLRDIKVFDSLEELRLQLEADKRKAAE